MMSRRIVISCWGSYGDVYPYVGLAKALKARGHRPLVAAPAFYRTAVEQEAIAFAAVGPDVDPSDRDVMSRVMHPATGSETVVRDLVVPALRQTYDDLRGVVTSDDVLVSHPLTFAVPILAEAQRLPWVSTVLAPLSFFSITDFPALPPGPIARAPARARPVVHQNHARRRSPRDGRVDGARLSAARRAWAASRRTPAV